MRAILKEVTVSGTALGYDMQGAISNFIYGNHLSNLDVIEASAERHESRDALIKLQQVNDQTGEIIPGYESAPIQRMIDNMEDGSTGYRYGAYSVTVKAQHIVSFTPTPAEKSQDFAEQMMNMLDGKTFEGTSAPTPDDEQDSINDEF